MNRFPSLASFLLTLTPALALAQAQPEGPPPRPASSAPAVVPQPTPAPSPIPAPTPAELARRRVPVDVGSTKPNAVLERQVSVEESIGAFIILPYRNTTATWEQVCVAPCAGVELDRYSTYRVAAANGISASGKFTLPQGASATHLDVDAGNLVAHRVGQASATIGLAAMIVGASVVLAATSFKHEDDARLAGWVTGGAGLVAFGVGLPLALLTRTRVTSDSRPIARFTPSGLVF